MAVVTVNLVATTPQVATKTCPAPPNPCPAGTNWVCGINQLDWSSPPVGNIIAVDWRSTVARSMFLQHSAVDNNRPKGPLFPAVYQVNRFVPEQDDFWTTIRTWGISELPEVGAWPSTFQESVPHSTFYYYRVIFIAQNAGGPIMELDSNIATVVQPYDLSICTPDSCTIPQGCQTLVWDAPVLTVPFITGTHVGQSECGGANGCYKIHVNWTYTPTPLSYDVYKSNVGPDSLVFAVNTTTSPLNTNNDWYDSDQSDRTMWYQFRALRPNGSVIPSNIVKISY